jgi:methionyl-tRNA formyltransferase
MSEPKVIVLCGSRFALPALQQLAFFKQLAVVAIPEQCEEMIENTKLVLTGTSIPVVTLPQKTFVKKITEAIKTHGVDTGLMLTFSYKIPSSVYNLPAKGFYNLHPGPLPGYRGPDPVFQQIRNKEKNAGVTIHKVDDDFDTGPVVMSEMIRLDSTDTYGILNEKLSYTAAKLTGTLLKLLSFDTAIPSRPQDESKAVYYQKQGNADVCINWQMMDASTIIALVNACNPWNKGAFTKLNNKMIRLMEAFAIDWPQTTEQIPGTIVAIDDRGLLVTAINNQVVCVQLIYIDEGFLQAKRLKQFGVIPGARFGLV